MAVTRTDESTDLLVRVELASGENVSYKNRTFKYIAPNTTDALVLTFGTRLAGLQSHTLNAVLRRDLATLVDE